MGQKLSKINSARRKCPEENAQFEQKLAAMSKTVDSLALKATEEKAGFDHKLAAMSEKIDLLVLKKTKEEKEFEERLAAMSDKINLLLEKMEERTAAESDEPTAITSIAPGSWDRSMLSDSSEQRRSQLPQLERAPSQEGAEEQPCSLPLLDRRGCTGFVNSRSLLPVSFDIIFDPPKITRPPRLHARSRVNLNEEVQDNTNKGLDWEQKECTAAQNSSTVSQPQEEMRLSPCPLTQTKAVKKEVCPSETRAEKKKKIMNRTWTKHTLKVQEKSADPAEELSLDANMQNSLEDSFVFLNSNEGVKKIKGLELIIQLAHSQPGVLIPKRQEVCQAIIAQVKCQRWTVSRLAMWTLAELFIHLKRHMDPELVWVAEVLLEKSASINKFSRQAATFALGHMIQNCSPLRCMEALLSRLREVIQGADDHKVAVRETIAAHLVTLVEAEGAQPFLGLEKEMRERFLSTVSCLTLDASERVRSCTEDTLAMLSAEQEANQ